MVKVWNDTGEPFPSSSCLHHLFESQARLTPHATALRWRGRHLTYAELNSRANLLARYLRHEGAGADSVVAVCLDRTPDLLVALLATLKAGAAYLPLDPAYPRQRLAFMLDDASSPVLITEEKYTAIFPDFAGTLLRLDAQWDEIARHTSPDADQSSDLHTLSDVESAATPSNLAYLIYTSGSTGRPKGVAIEHHSAVAFISWARRSFTAEELGGVLASTSVCFDLSVFELFAPLSCGGCVILADNALALPELEAAGDVRLINTVPSAIAELVRRRAVGPGVRTVNLAGEALHNSLAQELYATTRVGRVLNLYGPSEDTTYSTYALVERGATRAPAIGRPIGNGRVYVLDRRMRLVPAGVTGEIYVAGEGLARGYWRRPELTAERFVPDPYGEAGGGRMYRTGDVGRYGRYGEVEYLGRQDQQVKVRGYRIELGEIEEVLSGHEGVEQAAVVVREREGGDKRLVGYVVGKQGLRGKELKQYLRERLPEYMVPGELVQLLEMPLTANGKVDRAALPEVGAGVGGGDEVGFFELGGHSLLAAQAASRIGEVFKIELALRRVFESPSVAQLSAHIEAAIKQGEPASRKRIEARNDEQPLVLSYAQQRLWFLDQLEPNSSVYNMPAAFRLEGELDEAALEKSFAEIVRRHEVLRTRIETVEGQPLPVIEQSAAVNLRVVDLRDMQEQSRQVEAEKLIMEEARHPFDLSQAPLLRANLLRLKLTEHVLVLTLHHIAADGWSMKVLANELRLLYESFANGEESPLNELTIQYADYAAWQQDYLQGEVLETHLTYWKNHLEGMPPVLELPTDYPRPVVQSSRGASYTVLFEAELLRELKALSRAGGATLFITLLAAFKALLHLYTGQREIVVGSPFAGRNHAGVEDLIGLFVNTLVLRTAFSQEMTFRQLFDAERECVLKASAFQELPFEKLVEELQPERSLSHMPLFQVMFAMGEEVIEGFELKGLRIQPVEIDSGSARLDLTVWVKELREGLEAKIEYNLDLFEEQTIKRLASHFQNLLRHIVADPDKEIRELEILSDFEREEMVKVWNDTGEPFPSSSCLHHLFESQARLTPHATALRW
ncbi:MAG: amino acid adenylation domain-containing protein, partial [Acidobacteria bacterium]|nr:amino acid adenylation domain-containing protein [Acidobacteriota bacterium]